MPSPGASWAPQAPPRQPPHASLRLGTAHLLTLLRPATGAVRVKGVTRCPNPVLQAWLKSEVDARLATVPEPAAVPDPCARRAQGTRGQEGLRVRITLPTDLPPLRLLLIWDTLTGHHTPELLLWLFARGVLVRSTPLSGSWLTMAESIQRLLGRRALPGQQPQTPDHIITWREATATACNTAPTPFIWGGKRAARRHRAWQRRHSLGGSGAYATQSLQRRRYGLVQHK